MPVAQPECVDYLSFPFDAMDMQTCWREITRDAHRKEHAHRLENAAWRRFFQLRNSLPRMSPAKLNWLKHTDEVWLFGAEILTKAASTPLSLQHPFCSLTKSLC